MVANMQLQSSN